MAAKRRRCTGKTKAGKRCQAAPLKGSERCAAHPLSPDSARFGSPEQARAAGQLGGRPPKPRATELARRLVEENIAKLQRPYWRVLGYDLVEEDGGLKLVELPGGPAKLHTFFFGDLVVSSVDDLAAMMKAAEQLQDRAIGRPRQAVELTGEGGGAVQIEGDLADPDVREALYGVARAIDAKRSD